MATYKGMIRLKCVDLSNWASNQGIFNDVTTADPIRYSTEGMDTINVHVANTFDTLDALQTELVTAIITAIEKFSGMSSEFDMLMNGCKAVLESKAITQSFFMQLRTNYPYYIEVVIKVVE